MIKNYLNRIKIYKGRVETKRTPDLLIPDNWAIEIKIVRPFGDNGLEAENWSVNLLHPYYGNVSSIGDALKLKNFSGVVRKAVLVIGYEHNPPIINLDPLLASFELIAKNILEIAIGDRLEIIKTDLIHPVHQRVRVVSWEVL